MDSFDLKRLRDSFSYSQPCLRRWETSRPLRKLGISGKPLVVSARDEKAAVVHPSLPNISKNYELLKGFTSHMESSGIICTRLITPIKSAVLDFYELMERDVENDTAISVASAVANTVKKMLRVVRYKWQRWEMPRVPLACVAIFCYVFFCVE